jgi:hypothetical protein
MNSQVHAVTTAEIPPRAVTPSTATLDDGTEIRVYNASGSPIGERTHVMVAQAEHCGQWYITAADCG